MKFFRIVSSLFFLQGSICANGGELAREISSEANEVLANAHGGRSSPIVVDDFNLPLSHGSARQNDQPQASLPRHTSLGSFDLDLSLASISPDFSFRSGNSVSSHDSMDSDSDFGFRSIYSDTSLDSLDSDFNNSIDSAETRAIKISALEAAKKLNDALKRVNVVPFHDSFDNPNPEVYEAANSHDEVKEALKEVLISREAKFLNRALTPAEKKKELIILELHLELLKVKILVGPLTKEVLDRFPAVANSYQKYLEAKAQVDTERSVAEARSALTNQGVPIFTIAPHSDKQAAKDFKFALAAKGGRHEIGADADCLICMENYKEGSSIGWLKCKHHADVVCLARWLSANPSCPMCRVRVSLSPLSLE